MSGYYYQNEEEEDEVDQGYSYQPAFSATPTHPPPSFSGYTLSTTAPHPTYSINPQHVLRSQRQYTTSTMTGSSQSWTPMPPAQPPTSPPPAYYGYQNFNSQASNFFPQYSEPAPQLYQQPIAGPPTYLAPPVAGPSRPRVQRAASTASSVGYNTEDSRSTSPNAAEMAKWGNRNSDGTWSCAHPGCTSSSRFSRGCDLRKHYKRHTKTLFCRYDGCPQATRGGFSSKKDRLRHEAKHNPEVLCEWEGCDRLFSRVDNMKDHVRRVHLRHSSRD